MVDRNELLAEAEDLADMIMEAPEIEKYKTAEILMQANTEASAKLRRVKELQEQVAEFQARNVPPMHFAHLLEETEKLFGALEEFPEVRAFQHAQQEVNELLSAITRRLARAVLERVSDNSEPCENC